MVSIWRSCNVAHTASRRRCACNEWAHIRECVSRLRRIQKTKAQTEIRKKKKKMQLFEIDAMNSIMQCVLCTVYCVVVFFSLSLMFPISVSPWSCLLYDSFGMARSPRHILVKWSSHHESTEVKYVILLSNCNTRSADPLTICLVENISNSLVATNSRLQKVSSMNNVIEGSQHFPIVYSVSSSAHPIVRRPTTTPATDAMCACARMFGQKVCVNHIIHLNDDVNAWTEFT